MTIVADPAGFPIDTSRPPLFNKDGSTSTERSRTVQGLEFGLTGKEAKRWFNIPSIVNGKEATKRTYLDDAKRLHAQGWLFPNFAGVKEAEQQAAVRSSAIRFARDSQGVFDLNPANFPDMFDG